jgi:hypothetical protein
VALRDHVGHRFFDFRERLSLLRARRYAFHRRIFKDEPLQSAKPVRKILRAHQLQRVHLAGAQHDFVLAQHRAEHFVQRADVTAQFVFDPKLTAEASRVHLLHVAQAR